MQMHAAQMPGFGDAATWPACIGDPMDPRTEADDLLTEDSAFELAMDENERTPAHFADWLSTAADNGNSDRTPQDMRPLREAIEDGDRASLTTGELLAVLVAGSQQYAIEALYELRDRFAESAYSQEFLKGRVAELLAAQAEQEEGAHYDRLAEQYEEAA